MLLLPDARGKTFEVVAAHAEQALSLASAVAALAPDTDAGPRARAPVSTRPPFDSASGGQTDAHAPRHVTFLALSGANVYRVRPWVLVETAPLPWRVLDVLGAAGVDAAAVADLVLGLPQSAASSATAGASSIASRFLTGSSFHSVGESDATPPHVRDG